MDSRRNGAAALREHWSKPVLEPLHELLWAEACRPRSHGSSESAINFENEHNDADGNLYAGVGGGYLKIRTPGRPELLNVPAGRDDHGWEKSGQMGTMKFVLDPDKLQSTFSGGDDIPKVKTVNAVSIADDFFGVRTDETFPGAVADRSNPLRPGGDCKGFHNHRRSS
jgi:hypothetical protein